MNLQTLIALSRVRLDDNAVRADGTGGPYLWQDIELTAYLNEAQREAAERARLIRDETTDAVTLIPMVANQALYALHASVFDVDSARFEDTGEELYPTSTYELDNGKAIGGGYGWDGRYTGGYSRWRRTTSSRGRFFIVGVDPSEKLTLQLVPIPTEVEAVSPDDPNDTVPIAVRLTVYRYPLVEMIAPTDEPEINVKHHMRLIDWVAKRCFEKRDRDTYDPTKASDAEAAFITSFGPRNNANVQRHHRERRRETVRYNDL